MEGSGGQSFCAFLAKGLSVTLEGDANDYVSKVVFYAVLQFFNFTFICNNNRESNCVECHESWPAHTKR